MIDSRKAKKLQVFLLLAKISNEKNAIFLKG